MVEKIDPLVELAPFIVERNRERSVVFSPRSTGIRNVASQKVICKTCFKKILKTPFTVNPEASWLHEDDERNDIIMCNYCKRIIMQNYIDHYDEEYSLERNGQLIKLGGFVIDKFNPDPKVMVKVTHFKTIISAMELIKTVPRYYVEGSMHDRAFDFGFLNDHLTYIVEELLDEYLA